MNSCGKGKDKAVLVHSLRAEGGRREDITPFILNLDVRRRRVFSLTPQQLYSRGNIGRYSTGDSGRFEQKKNSFTSAGKKKIFDPSDDKLRIPARRKTL